MNRPSLQLKNFIPALFQQKTAESSIQYFLKAFPPPYLYFEWLAQKCAFKLLYSNPSFSSDFIRVYESDPSFDINQLDRPESISALTQIVEKAAKGQKMQAQLISVKKRPFGVFFFSNKNPHAEVLTSCLQCKCESLIWKNQCMKFSNYDYFLKNLYAEISRARRLSLPVSIVLISCASYLQVKSDKNLQLFFKSLYNHLLKNSRMYDSIIQISPREMALILPHTSQKGAVEKARQIDWVLNSLSQTQIFKTEVQFKAAVAEYPSSARDAAGLIKIARKSCEYHENKGICIAAAPPSFQPDFSVKNQSIDHLCEIT